MDHERILGIDFGQEPAQLNRLMESMRETLARWEHRQLTFVGKTIVLNSLVMSKLWFYASVVPIPPSNYAAITGQNFRYLWSSARDWVQRNIVVRPKEDGGLKIRSVPVMDAALKCRFLVHCAVRPSAFTCIPAWYLARATCSTPATWWLHLAAPNAVDLTSLPPFLEEGVLAWRRIMRALQGAAKVEDVGFLHHGGFMDLAGATNAAIYDALLADEIRREPDEPVGVTEWRAILGAAHVPADWRVAFRAIWDALVSNEAKQLNWQLLQRRLPTLLQLTRAGLVDDERCWFCRPPPEENRQSGEGVPSRVVRPADEETNEHLFVFCPVVADFWRSLGRSPASVVFDTSWEMLVAKYVVWKTRSRISAVKGFSFESLQAEYDGMLRAMAARRQHRPP